MRVALPYRRGDVRRVLELGVDVLNLDGRLVHQDANRERQTTQRHDVDGLPCQPKGDHRPQQGEGNVENNHDDAAPVAQEQQHHQAGEDCTQETLGQHTSHGSGDMRRLVELKAHVDVFGQHGLHARQVFLDLVHDGKCRGVGPLGHQDVDRPPAVDQGVSRGNVRAVLDDADVAQVNVRPRPDGDIAQLARVFDHCVHRDDRHLVLDAGVAGRRDRVARGEGGDDGIGRQVVSAQPLGIHADDNRPLVAPEGRRRRDAGQAGEHRPHAEQGLILNLADGFRVAGQHQIADRHAAGIEAHDERRHRAGRHERARAINVADHLRHRLGHVHIGVEIQLHQGGALDVLRLDVVDAGDVEKMVLVVVRDQAFHLRGIEPAIGLGHVDDRQIETGENVDLHPRQGEHAPQNEREHAYHDGVRMPQCKDDRIHRRLCSGASAGCCPHHHTMTTP